MCITSVGKINIENYLSPDRYLGNNREQVLSSWYLQVEIHIRPIDTDMTKGISGCIDIVSNLRYLTATREEEKKRNRKNERKHHFPAAPVAPQLASDIVLLSDLLPSGLSPSVSCFLVGFTLHDRPFSL